MNLGAFATEQGDLIEARALHETSLSSWPDVGQEAGIVLTLTNLAEVVRLLGDSWGSANALKALARTALVEGDLERAGSLLAESLAFVP
jgi:hypothetical protein